MACPRPATKRSTHAATLERINNSVITPAKVKRSDPDFRSRDDIEAFEAFNDERLRSIKFTTKVDASAWSILVTFVINIIYKIGQAFAKTPADVEGVQQKLLFEVGKRLIQNSSSTHHDESVPIGTNIHDFTSTCLEYARLQHPLKKQVDQHTAKEVIRAIAVNTLTRREIDELQEQKDVPAEERLSYGEHQRRAARKDYARIIEGEDVESDDEFHELSARSRIVDEVVFGGVQWVVEYSNFLSWGVKKVKLDGEMVEIPKLTRKVVPEEMWEAYANSFVNEKEGFDHIVSFTEVKRHSSEYNGSSYNLQVLWNDLEVSVKPLAELILDDPISCAVFGYENGLLQEPGWQRLRKLVDDNGQPKNQRKATKSAFRGKRKMMQRTAFLDVVRALTAENEKLVTAVDYVKGVLVLDVVDVLQRIINDHIPAEEKVDKAALTKSLTVLTNFLKNQYKNHVFQDGGNNTGTHGAKHGLSVPPCPKKHYSEMSIEELDSILDERGIATKKLTKLARVKLLEDDDAQRNESSASSTTDSTGTDTSSDGDTAVIDQYTQHVNGMNLLQLRAEMKRMGLTEKSTKKQPLRDALIDLHQKTQVCNPINKASSSDNEDVPSESLKSSFDEELNPIGDDECLGCAFLHYYMLEELPNAIQERMTDNNCESIENALQFIKDAHEKMVLYQGHIVRSWNQSKALEEMERKLFDNCVETKSTEPSQLWCIVDFKMKWEAMHQREKMTEGFAKRGTSWHGNYLTYYLWNEEEEMPEKYVVKLDQIIDGTNEQTGQTVLGLLEALLVFVKEEFPGANIEYLQSDNAQCYHLKELVLAIPQLNARMKQFGGPVIKNFVHTETQDGKCLLDAHFAHATALVKRYLRRIRPNQQNKVTSPAELADALSSKGGLQNCSVQLILFDSDVANHLQAISAYIGPTAKKLKEYFTRSNEINYFPSTDSECGKQFEIHVKAYSGIGHGARFRIDITKNTVVVADASEEDLDMLMEHLTMEQDEDELQRDDGNGDNDMLSADAVMAGREICDEEEEEDDPNEAFYLLASVEEMEMDATAKALKSTNGNAAYWANDMVTGVKVEKYMPLGTVLSSKVSSTVQRRLEQEHCNAKLDMDVVSRALRYLQSEAYGRLGIRQGDNEDQAIEFQRVKEAGFVVPEEFKMKVGWARRKPRGRMYGKKYIRKYRSFIYEMFMRGVRESSLKMGPSMMLEAIRKLNPNIYTLPNFVEIQTFIGNLFDRQKKNKLIGYLDYLSRAEEDGIGDGDGDTDEVDSGNAVVALQIGIDLDRATTIKKESLNVLEKYGGAIEPKWALLKLSNLVLSSDETNYAKKYIMSQRSILKKHQKRAIIG